MVSSTFHAENLWKTLSRATVDKKHPWRVVGFSTSGHEGVNSRNIILRSVEYQQALVTFYTDLRSGKIADLAHDPRVSLLFWNPRSNEQLRAWGKASVVSDSSLLEKHWSRIPDYAKKDYSTLSAPGVPLTEWVGDTELGVGAVGGAIGVGSAAEPLLDLNNARRNFRIIQVQVQRMDYLKLDREGHQRVGLSLNDGLWKTQALVP